ncbi:MAG: hypothetical protein CSA62_13320 [Planctomycetota bacterium]|nr:MAG: hypothetical protein CSA62_13320 [Planctomycetota bacterium]
MTPHSTRRSFLKSSLAGGLGAGLTLPNLNLLGKKQLAAAAPEDQILIVFQLRGGNDAWNNLFPAKHSTFRAARSQLAIPVSKAIQLKANSDLYLHPALAPLKKRFDAGEVAMLPGVGYPNPNYSHFRSLDIVAAFDPKAATAYRGWLAEYLKHGYTGSYAIPAIDFESRLNRMFVGRPVPTFTKPSAFKFRFDPATPVDDQVEAALLESNAKVLRAGAGAELDFTTKAVASAPADANLIQATGANWSPKSSLWPSANRRDRHVTRYLQYCARYIISGLKTQVYLFSLGGFDTHANQVANGSPEQGNHADLLGAMAQGIDAFFDELKRAGQEKRAVVYVCSEFGRRAGENANLGSDHGAAGISYLVGPQVKGGVHSPYPDWSKVSKPYNRANIQYTVDFRSVYATIIEKYWKVDHSKVLGQKFPLLGLF